MTHGDSPSNSIATGRDARDTRVGQILNDFLDRRARGEAVSEAALLAQHPDLAGELRQCLELVQDLQPPADRIEALITQGMLSKPSDPRYLAELGSYKITDFIGRGGMGVVLEAYEESLDRTVALKILRPELAADGGALTRFEREAKAAAALRHPNIVTVYAVGQERGVHFIAMEYVAGPSLAEVIREEGTQPRREEGTKARRHGGTKGREDIASGLCAGRPDAASGLRAGRTEPRPSGSGREGEPPAEPDTGKDTADTAVPRIPLGAPGDLLSPDLIRSIFRQLLSALAAAHDAGLIHRDVKSSNILLDGWERKNVRKWERAANGRDDEPSHVPTLPRSHDAAGVPPALVKLADFGLARMLTAETRLTLTDSVLGTPEYMSPEQARGDAEIDHRTDLYSAGVVLYEMLTGRTPFRADTPTATIHRILHEDPADPRKLAKNVDPNLSGLALRLMAKRPDDRFVSGHEALEALQAGGRVRSLAHRRRLRRHLATALIGLAILAAGAWLAPRLVLGPPKVTAVRVDPDTRCAIQVRYGDDSDWQILHRFASEVGGVRGPMLIDLDGRGRKAVIAGFAKPSEGSNVVAFDAQGKRLWGGCPIGS